MENTWNIHRKYMENTWKLHGKLMDIYIYIYTEGSFLIALVSNCPRF